MFAKAIRLFIIYICTPAMLVHAQDGTKSPYSRFGLGDMQFGGNATQSSLGQVTQGMRKPYELNTQNPASYGGLKLTTIEAGYRYSSGDISNSLNSNHIYNASFAYLNVGIPISEKLRWGAAFGVQPYSSVGYNVASQQDFGEFPAVFRTIGSGGLSKLYLGTGIAVLKNLSVGANMSYLWGQLASTNDIIIPIDYNKYNLQESRTYYIGDLHFDYGVQYHKIYKNAQKEPTHRLVIGSTFNMANPLKATQDYTVRSMGVGGLVVKDTIANKVDAKGTVDLPFMIKVGGTLEAYGKWALSADVNYANWSSYRVFGSSDSLKNSLGAAVGVSYLPDSNINKNYLKRIEYRLGARYDNGYLNMYGHNIATYGISAGVGLPVGLAIGPGRRSRSKLNFTVEYFVRGTTSDRLIREEYWRFTLGITFCDLWFHRYKYY
jgi:hypothetical protein